MKLKDLFKDVVHTLRVAAIEDYAINAKLILQSALKIEEKDLFLKDEDELNDNDVVTVTQMVGRRLKHEPLQYILGETSFFLRKFICDKRALIPRPESETIPSLVLKKLPKKPLKILDVGTGSGVLAITLKCEIPEAEVYGCDISTEALSLAKQNAQKLSVDINFVCTDLYPKEHKDFQVVVANLPYVPNERMVKLQKELNYEPKIALDGGKYGLEVVDKFWQQTPKFIKKTGALIITEVDCSHIDKVVLLAKKFLPEAKVSKERDLFSKERFVVAEL